MKRIVIDANTLASGSIDPHSDSPPCLLFSELEEMRFEAIICPQLIVEVVRGLRKPYFRERVDEEAIAEITAGIVEAATVLADPVDPEPLLRDPKTTTSLRSPAPPKRTRSSQATKTCLTTPTCNPQRSMRAAPASCSD